MPKPAFLRSQSNTSPPAGGRQRSRRDAAMAGQPKAWSCAFSMMIATVVASQRSPERETTPRARFDAASAAFVYIKICASFISPSSHHFGRHGESLYRSAALEYSMRQNDAHGAWPQQMPLAQMPLRA